MLNSGVYRHGTNGEPKQQIIYLVFRERMSLNFRDITIRKPAESPTVYLSAILFSWTIYGVKYSG
jgi:hypothetical protein